MKLFKFFWHKKPKPYPKNHRHDPIPIIAPVNGNLIALESVKDEAFASKTVGEGFAFEPADGNFISPFTGEIVVTYPSKHAYAIQNDQGIEILLHIGLDTVELEGKGFKTYVKEGQKVKAGDRLVDMDLPMVSKLIPTTETPLVFVEQGGRRLEIIKKGPVKQGEIVAYLK